jgi:HD-GYP domain-containing protein (c-di-GMP phosphodiesterase class II)
MRTKLLFLVLFIPLALMGQDLTQRYIDNANRQFILGDYEKAYSSINFVLRSTATTGDELGVESIVIAEKVYYNYLNEAISSNDTLVISDIEQNLLTYANVSSARIKLLQENYQAQLAEQARLDELARQQEELLKQQEAERQREAELQAIRDREREAYEARERELREMQAAADSQSQELIQQQLIQAQQQEQEREARRAEERRIYEERQAQLAREQMEMERRQREEFNQLISLQLENQQASDEEAGFQNMLIILIVSILGVVVVLGFFGIVFLMMKHSQQQQQSFDYTVNSIRTLRSDQMLAAAPSAGEPMMLEDNSSVRALPPGTGSNSGNSDLKDKIKLLIETCKSYGAQIDEVTGRKNATKNVSKLVHTISKSFGYNNSQAMLHYMAGLIYDIGFLNIDPEIFQKDTLTDEEFQLVQEHPKIGTNMIHFIDKNLQQVFLDAIKYHHENLDGTGYPYGISGDEIPFIARVIRVVESYVALVSSRIYKNITDKESAIDELMKNDAHYDLSIIQALNDIV